MLSLLDIAERAQKGPKMEVKAWDLALFRKGQELADRHDLRYPGHGVFFNRDDAPPRRALQAAIDFLVEQGVYCLTTGRVLQFAEAEVRQAIAEAPREVIVGEGRDARVLRQKRVEGRDPLNQTPGHHAPFSEEVAPLVVMNYARIPTADYLEGFNFTNVDGREVFGMPLEAYAARREVAWMREGVRKAGRPGMAIAFYPISTRAGALVAPMDADYGLRRTDGILLSTLPDVKIELDLLTAAIVYGDYGAFKVNGGGGGGIGGFCGGVEGAIIEAIAKAIGGWLCYRDHIAGTGVGHTAATTWPTIQLRPETVWATSVVCQALNSYTGIICFGGGGGQVSGPGTKSHLLEMVSGALCAPIDGYNLYVSRQARAQMNASQTPLEPEWMMEVAQAAIRTGLTRASAGEVLGKLASRINGLPPEAGQDIRLCYDLARHRPKPEYEALYLEVKDEVSGLGLQFV